MDPTQSDRDAVYGLLHNFLPTSTVKIQWLRNIAGLEDLPLELSELLQDETRLVNALLALVTEKRIRAISDRDNDKVSITSMADLRIKILVKALHPLCGAM